MPSREDTHQPLSGILKELAERDVPRISVHEIVEHFGGRALGGLLLIFGLACSLPLPPGGSTIFGAPLLLLAPQLVIGTRTPWIPVKLRNSSIAAEDLRKGLPRVLKWLERVESVSRPRLTFLFGPIGDRFVGLVCFMLGLVLILPIPGGNLLPAAAVSVLSLALVQRDGLLALLGYLLTAISVGILVLAAGIVTRGFDHLIAVFTHA